ncbi:MAG: hypothetical protein AB2421_04660 [Thermotaleaceae bacterium]
MDNQSTITTGSYFWALTKIFFKSLKAHYISRDDDQLEALYYETLDLHEQYIDIYCDEQDKEEQLKEKIYELLDLILLKEQKDILRMKTSGRTFKGLKLRENIIHDIYVELWLLGKNLWLYTFGGKDKKENIIPFDIENPYLIRIDQVYVGLKAQRVPGLLRLLYKKEKENKK